jgi:proteasome activator subunit 4
MQIDRMELTVKNRFSLADPADPRYQRVLGLRERFGGVLHRAAVALQHSETEDHIDAVIQLCKGIDVYLLEYAINRSTYSGTAKSFLTRRECVSSTCP